MDRVTQSLSKLTAVVTGFLGIALISASAALAQGQSAVAGVNSSSAAIQLAATLPSQLRLSLSEVALDINVCDPTQSSAAVTVPVTSSWVLDSGTNNVELVGYFDSPAMALSDDAGHAIPANHVLGGLAEEVMMPFGETSRLGIATASRTLFRQQIGRRNVTGSRSDMLKIQLSRIDDVAAPAGEYRGTLHLRLVSY